MSLLSLHDRVGCFTKLKAVQGSCIEICFVCLFEIRKCEMFAIDPNYQEWEIKLSNKPARQTNENGRNWTRSRKKSRIQELECTTTTHTSLSVQTFWFKLSLGGERNGGTIVGGIVFSHVMDVLGFGNNLKGCGNLMLLSLGANMVGQSYDGTVVGIIGRFRWTDKCNTRINAVACWSSRCSLSILFARVNPGEKMAVRQIFRTILLIRNRYCSSVARCSSFATVVYVPFRNETRHFHLTNMVMTWIRSQFENSNSRIN